jgi:hypothetical protein
MKEAGSASGSRSSRSLQRRASVWASSCTLACVCACSGSTDVVGVFDDKASSSPSSNPSQQSSDTNVTQSQNLSATGASSSDSAGDAEELLVVAGLPLRDHDYDGPTFEWPLGVPLHAFFAESSWPEHPGPPANVERNAFARMGGVWPGGNLPDQRRDDVRFVVASEGPDAQRLIDVFETASNFYGTEPRSLVLRDAWGDEYLVVLGTTTTDCMKATSHHSGPCAEPNPYSNDPSFEAP